MGRRAGRRPLRGRPRRAGRALRGRSTARPRDAEFPQDPRTQLHGRRRRRVRLVEHAPRPGVPACERDSRRPRHGGERRPDGLRQQEATRPRRASPSRATRRPASPGCSASSSSTRRARTSSPASVRPSRSSGWRDVLPEAYEQLARDHARLETHYREMQDIEFTVEEGRLYLLQTRTGKRTAAAALRIAVDMAAEGLISREEAVVAHRPRPARPAPPSDDRPRRPRSR